MLRSYRYRVGNNASDKCKSGEIDDRQHAVLDFPMIQTKRLETLGPNTNPEILWTNPESVNKHLRVSGKIQTTTA